MRYRFVLEVEIPDELEHPSNDYHMRKERALAWHLKQAAKGVINNITGQKIHEGSWRLEETE